MKKHFELKKAETLEEIYAAFKVQPLTIEQLDYYIPVDEARDTVDPVLELMDNLRMGLDDDSSRQYLFIGYKGSGKSTEFRRLENEIQNDFLVVNISVFEELNYRRIEYLELIVLIMEKLFEAAEAHKVELDPDYIKRIKEFLGKREIEEVKSEKSDVDGSVGVGFDINVSLLNIFSKMRGRMRYSDYVKHSYKKKIEPYFSEFMNGCNGLIRELKLNLPKIGRRNLLIIIDDLEKVDSSQVKDIFAHHANHLIQIETNIIYAYPIELYHHPEFNIDAHNFEPIRFPIIKVNQMNGEPSAKGVEIVKKIVAARMNTNLFEDPEILDNLIRLSGGSLRDLFRFISDAAQSARLNGRKKIDKQDQERAIIKLKRDFKSSIADFRDKDGQLYEAEKYYETLHGLYDSPTKDIKNDYYLLHLRRSLHVLDYNGEGWCDVHPVVKLILDDRRPPQ